jgi:ABC-2 type transport system permease protein
VTRGLQGLGLVAGRELRVALARRSFWIVVAVLALGSTAALVVPDLVGGSSSPRYDVGVVARTPSLDAALRAAVQGLDAELRLHTLPGAAAAERGVDDGRLDLAVVADGGGASERTIVVRAGEHERLVGAVQQALAVDALTSRLTGAGLSPSEITGILSQRSALVQELDADDAARRGASFAVSLVLYLLLLTLMMQAANGTAVEKSNRISEVLLAIVRPGALLFGKVAGIAAVGGITVVAGLAPVVVKLGVSGDLPPGLGAAALGGAAWFVLGLVLYLSVAAALGALVERPEEAGAAVMPLMGILIATFVVVQGGADSGLGEVLAYLPFTSSLTEPSRLAMGVSSPLEVVGSLAVGAVAVAASSRFASTVYARAIVRTGRRLRVGDVVRLPRARRG